jgi:hypothetical protein
MATREKSISGHLEANTASVVTPPQLETLTISIGMSLYGRDPDHPAV